MASDTCSDHKGIFSPCESALMDAMTANSDKGSINVFRQCCVATTKQPVTQETLKGVFLFPCPFVKRGVGTGLATCVETGRTRGQGTHRGGWITLAVATAQTDQGHG